MAHPLYHTCCKLVKRNVTLYHANGRGYYGTIYHVTSQGIYLAPAARPVHLPAGEKPDAHTAEQHTAEGVEGTEAYWGGFFFPFGLVTGLTLGYVLGASTYPYHGYGYYW